MVGKFITLTTDFGWMDAYVAAMKGVILSISPDCQIVDITHSIQPQNLWQAAIVLSNAVDFYPDGTIHVAVVDPGVGSSRAVIAVKTERHLFLAPDNGILELIFKKNPYCEVRRVENGSLFMPKVSHTFHGRDIFSPVAAHLANGVPFAELGPIITEFERYIFPNPKLRGRTIEGEIIYCDHFGNLMTNVHESDLAKLGSFNPSFLHIHVADTCVNGLSKTYSDVELGELVCLFGSTGYLEVSIRQGSAYDRFRLPIGSKIVIESPK
ncbi:MAG: SAM-dependent chlorinase/fluorinase [bacterium]